MVTTLIITAAFSLIMLLYIYIGYPVLLAILSIIKPAIRLKKEKIFPEVTLIISCFDEEDVIREKLQNTFELDYPKEKLGIVVVSDGSTDKTDEIVAGFESSGVKLVRQEGRLGKTSGINLAMAQIESEIVVFSDANAIYKNDSIQKLVENFADEKVGYVVGYAKYTDSSKSSSANSENTYWNYEFLIKKLESRVHSVVGGDGAIYAIRRTLYDDLLQTDINDFVNPLQIISKGYRGVFEPDAICYEEAADTFHKEFNRKARIVNRSFTGLLRIKSVMNPFKAGLFSWQIISHKLLRWFTFVFLISLTLSSITLALCDVAFFKIFSQLLLSFYFFGYLGYVVPEKGRIPSIFFLPYYFIIVNIASVKGIYNSIRGDVKVTWSTIRSNDSRKNKASISIHMIAVILIVLYLVLAWGGNYSEMVIFYEEIIFWLMLVITVYVYFGYPLTLFIMKTFSSKDVLIKDITPDVTLLICAYNEEDVIEEKILNSLQIDYPTENLNIVIASDGSDDSTNEIVRKYENTHKNIILYSYPDRGGKISVINKTVPELKTEIIVFSDANAMYAKDALKKLVRNFNDPNVGGVSADVILENEEAPFGEGESTYYSYERWIQENESALGSIVGADGAMYAIRRNLFKKPSPNTILDDFVISMNVVSQGYRLIYEKEALGYEKNSTSNKTEFLRRSRVIAGAVQILKQKEGLPDWSQKQMLFFFISHKLLRWVLPIILVSIFCMNLHLTVTTGPISIYGFLLSIQLLFYITALVGAFFQKEYANRLIVIPYYFCLTNSAALYGLYKGVFNKQSVKWRVFKRT